MTYCVGMRLDKGLVFMADTRTSAGVDNFAVTRKMFSFEVPGERSIVLMTAGNLATTQAMISLLEERSKTAEERDPSILRQSTMFQVARLVGETLNEVIVNSSPNGQGAVDQFRASVILGGQIGTGKPTIFLIYPEGNFIEITDDTPFFQIGETKYGKPILVRTYDREMSFEDAVKLLLVSFDSTVKSNLSVGLPFDLMIYDRDSLNPMRLTRIDATDSVYQAISNGWGDALKDAFQQLPSYTLKN
ncbi:peptidase [Sulfitobacter pseudonitzschiae]|uniref:Peptidase n=1 Tax=Pseudosulfitobacter pseudonitzschiae TaxID=1402135 RepID=A0A9Q2RU25_9RHOB|nr:peptidase [Pseudosulfitobacter pseudonitzschiae]MBM2294044.1 peptidase [Pseudosulfitobacter pseudonitzschiae]MBM2298967.1 peptidase [Pseudosulfitobacter pseudonitzschiae]MBM2303875.1 peptidase [Pseudosulfitobacter pseudonitzschiae]MBM2313629.1 peptidase [Pseudosulfitobacter pseudonitzschiae]MBM2318543.1 peptidase [Pseudosulfitobacter pseudonitzschiae]